MANTKSGEQRVYLQGEMLVDQADEKQSVSTLDRLYEMASAKDPKVFELFKKNAMDMEHYMEFMKTCITFDFADAIRTKSYVVVFSANKQGSYFVIGIDDTTGRLFCHRLPSGNREWIDTDKKVREAMGFDTECLEPHRRIRIQGDLTMQIMDQAESPEGLLEPRVYEELENRVGDVAERSGSRPNCTRLKEIAQLPEHFYMLGNDIEFVKDLMGRYGMMTEKAEFDRLEGTGYLSAYVRKAAHDLLGRIRYQEELNFLKKNRERIVQHAYDRMSRGEGRYTVMQGEHKITITAAAELERDRRIRDMIREQAIRQIMSGGSGRMRIRIDGNRITFYVLRPSTITIEHAEHGKRELMIMKPSAIRFGMLNRFHEAEPGSGQPGREAGEPQSTRAT